MRKERDDRMKYGGVVFGWNLILVEFKGYCNQIWDTKNFK